MGYKIQLFINLPVGFFCVATQNQSEAASDHHGT